jgi:hypothetical protein
MLHAQRPFRTYETAKPASRALAGPVHDLLLEALAFGIVAPEARGRTTLEKHGGSYARPIVYRISPDVKNAAVSHASHHTMS